MSGHALRGMHFLSLHFLSQQSLSKYILSIRALHGGMQTERSAAGATVSDCRARRCLLLCARDRDMRLQVCLDACLKMHCLSLRHLKRGRGSTRKAKKTWPRRRTSCKDSSSSGLPALAGVSTGPPEDALPAAAAVPSQHHKVAGCFGQDVVVRVVDAAHRQLLDKASLLGHGINDLAPAAHMRGSVGLCVKCTLAEDVIVWEV